MGLFSKFFGGPTIRVHMLKSVDEHVAGENYDLPIEVADRYIIRGYAEGNLSREYTEDELQQMRVNVQVVQV